MVTKHDRSVNVPAMLIIVKSRCCSTTEFVFSISFAEDSISLQRKTTMVATCALRSGRAGVTREGRSDRRAGRCRRRSRFQLIYLSLFRSHARRDDLQLHKQVGGEDAQRADGSDVEAGQPPPFRRHVRARERGGMFFGSGGRSSHVFILGERRAASGALESGRQRCPSEQEIG